MKIFIKTSLFTLLFITSSFSQLNFDTVTNLQMGMGIFYKKYIEYSKPWHIYVLEIDMSVPYNSIETIKAQDKLAGYEKTSSMARRRSYPGHVAVGAINGDFYGGTGIPINIQVRNGEILRGPGAQSTIGFNEAKKPMLARVIYSGSLRKGNQSRSVYTVNSTRGDNQLILYNKYYGSSTGTNSFGTEIKIRPMGGWAVNDTMSFIVTSKESGVGSMVLNDTTWVLSGHGTASTFLVNNINVGDTVKLFTGVAPGIAKLKELIGGFPKIIYNGADYVDQGYLEEGGPSHAYERHPRTATGFSQDSNKVYFVVVDGRSAQSIGMTLHELADFMQRIGVYQGINLDGGGSTTFFVRDSVMNVTSDGVERTVSNALAVFTSSPQGSLNKIRISPNSYRLYHSESVSFSAYGFDDYFNPVPVNQSLVTYSVTPGIGVLDGNTFIAGNDPDTGFVYLDYQGLRDSALIIVKGITRIQLSPESSVTDTSRLVPLKAQAWDLDGTPRNLELNLYDWSVANPLIGTIDTIGRFKGISGGTTQVIANHRGNKDTVEIIVEIGTTNRVLSSMDNLNGWTLDHLLMDTTGTKLSISTDTFTTSPGALKVDYKYTYQPGMTNYIFLKSDIPIFGVPDSIHLDVKADGPQHHVTYSVTDEDNELFRITMAQYITSVMFEETKTAVSRAVPGGTSGTLYFPLRLKEIQIRLSGTKVPGQVYTGTIYFDNLQVSYPANHPVSVKHEDVPTAFGLWGNFPNPFNPETKISYSLSRAGHTNLTIYDITGSVVTKLINESQLPGNYQISWNANHLPSGVYIAVLDVFGEARVHKMLLLK